jgi:RNA polymerase sigma factor (sigma-70 family)
MPLPTTAADLVVRARSGDATALTEVYERFGDRLMALAFRLTGSQQDAEDVLHDVFLGLPEALAKYDERGSFESWVKRVTARVALSKIRTREREREVDLADVHIAPESGAMHRLTDLVAVQRAIDALPDTLRVVFVLREVEGYSHAEIAAVLEISTNASEVRLHRAIRALRQTLGGDS